jgi:hypothetical protein
MPKHTRVPLGPQAPDTGASHISTARRHVLSAVLAISTMATLAFTPVVAPLAAHAFISAHHPVAAVPPRGWGCGSIPLPC